MTRPLTAVGVVLALALLIDGCARVKRDATAVTSDGLGPTVRVEPGTLPSASGCELEYLRYLPHQAAAQDLVILGHGFLRSKARMARLAGRLAQAGIPTVAMDFCNMRFWDGGHEQNGDDMVAVARHLEAQRIVYAGFSAGGLAAVVAARRDVRALGVVAMDLVDRDGIGVAAATGLERPLVGLVGDPSRCNARNNGLEVFAAAAEAEVIRIPGASHCDFEAPTDTLCRVICEPEGHDNGDELRTRILDLTVAAIASLLNRKSPAVVRAADSRPDAQAAASDSDRVARGAGEPWPG